MTTLNCDNLSHSRNAGDDAELAAPAWADALVGANACRSFSSSNGLEMTAAQGAKASLVSVRYAGAIHATPERLEACTIQMYQLIRETLQNSRHRYPVRVWNFLPAIHQQLDPDRDRYMVFNSGRFKAYCQWWGGPESLAPNVPTASGVGHRGNDLVVHCLASDRPGIAVENPRQIPALGYSRRFGPQPPCFARATVMGKSLLLGGTASICGEQSMHLNELQAQTNETLINVSAVVTEATTRITDRTLSADRPLELFTSLRIYHPDLVDRDSIKQMIQSRFANVTEIEYLRADLCRPELLIEIEGVADLS